MKRVVWYFDFISPYAYLQSRRLSEFTGLCLLTARPVLFAGLLKHWQNVGPAELEPKRRWTYEHCVWLAREHGIPFRMPGMHPFNPLPLLRLALAGSTDGSVPLAVVERLFRYVWVDGFLPSDAAAWAALLTELAVTPETLSSSRIKDLLRANGEAAIADQVFGVPAAVTGERQFWGFDATAMLIDWLQDDPLFASDEFRRVGQLPVGLQRAARHQSESARTQPGPVVPASARGGGR